MKWIAIAGAVLLVLIVAVVVVGAFLPREHEASRTLHMRRPPADVWAAIAGFDQMPSWRPDVKKMERLPDRDGSEVWMEDGANGKMPFQVVVSEPPRRLVTRIADPSLPFGGTWTYEIVPETGGAAITITERGWVSNPIFRFMARIFMDPNASIDRYLKNLGDRLER